jgi:hypothetical protein
MDLLLSEDFGDYAESSPFFAEKIESTEGD